MFSLLLTLGSLPPKEGSAEASRAHGLTEFGSDAPHDPVFSLVSLVATPDLVLGCSME